MIKPRKGRNKKAPFSDVEIEQLKELKDAIGDSEEVEPFKEYFMDFGTTAFIESIKGGVGDLINSEWGSQYWFDMYLESEKGSEYL